MAVKFISHVEQTDDGKWFIKLTDTLEEIDVICKDLDEYAIKIEEMGSEYGNDIEVVWTKSKLLTPKNYQDLMTKMETFQKKYQDEIDKAKENEKNTQDGFNPNE